MSTEPKYESEFFFLGEFVDESPLLAGAKPSQWASANQAHIIEFEDSMSDPDGIREFRVVLKDGSVAVIQGHSVSQEVGASSGQQLLLAIKLRVASNEICVARFNGEDVAEIFDGAKRIDLKSA